MILARRVRRYSRFCAVVNQRALRASMSVDLGGLPMMTLLLAALPFLASASFE
jgi:hypothetical protein